MECIASLAVFVEVVLVMEGIFSRFILTKIETLIFAGK